MCQITVKRRLLNFNFMKAGNLSGLPMFGVRSPTGAIWNKTQ